VRSVVDTCTSGMLAQVAVPATRARRGLPAQKRLADARATLSPTQRGHLMARPRAVRGCAPRGSASTVARSASAAAAASLLLAVLLACVPAASGVDQAPTPWAGTTPRVAADVVRRTLRGHHGCVDHAARGLQPAQRRSRARSDIATTRMCARACSSPPRARSSLTWRRR
jgi:hypothetical protein